MRLRRLQIRGDLDAGRRRNDQRPREERMRQQRHDAEGIDARSDEGTTRREEVCRRAGWSCNADAVGGNLRRGSVIDAQTERNEPRDLAFSNDDVVEREEALLSVFGLQRGALVHEQAACDECRQIVEPRIVFVELREEAQTTGVDAKQRNVALDCEPRGPQQRAVAADGDHQGRLCDVRAVDDLEPVRAKIGRNTRCNRASVLARRIHVQPDNFFLDRKHRHHPSPTTASSRASSNGSPRRRSSIKNSRFPAGPTRGEAVNPTGTRPRARTAARSSHRTWRCVSGSRTTPPAARRARPASNCGFTSATIAPSSRKYAVARCKIVRSEINDVSMVIRSKPSGNALLASFRKFVRSITRTRESLRSRQSSCP